MNMEGWKLATLATFRYVGPTNSSFTLPPETEGGPTRDVLLYRGREVDLPPDNEYVKGLVFQKFLIPVEKLKTTTKTTTKKAETKE